MTLGSLVLISTSPATAFPQLPAPAFADLQTVCHRLETAVKGAFACDKFNYLMLMMVDPHVHFHVLPRYERSVHFAGEVFEDGAWPGPPDLARTHSIGEDTAAAIAAELCRYLPADG